MRLHIRNLSASKILSCTILFLSYSLFSQSVSADALDSIQPGTWYKAPNSNLSTAYPTKIPVGNSGPAAIMDAWNGGAFDSKRNRLLVWGGGHWDYAGNEIYGFDIAQMKWLRLSEPSDPVTVCADYNPDGQPAATHTYNTLQYIASTDRFVQVGGGSYGGDCPTYSHTNLFNFDTGKWERGAGHSPMGHTTGRITAYDSKTGNIWAHGTYGGSKLAEYDPKSNTWTSYGSGEYLEIYTTAAIDPDRRLMVAVGGYDQILYWNLNLPGWGTVPKSTGDKTLEGCQGPGFEYDPVIKKFVGWCGGANVYILDPDTWNWTRVGPASGNTVTPTAQNSRGTYGRFRYIPSKNVYVVVNAVNQDVYFYRLSAGNGAALPTVELTASPSNVNVNEFSNLVWSSTGSNCVASGGWSGSMASVGSQNVGPITQDTTFTLQCQGSSGQLVGNSVTVTVNTGGDSGGGDTGGGSGGGDTGGGSGGGDTGGGSGGGDTSGGSGGGDTGGGSGGGDTGGGSGGGTGGGTGSSSFNDTTGNLNSKSGSLDGMVLFVLMLLMAYRYRTSLVRLNAMGPE